MKDIFTATETDELINRINKLTPETKPQWGKMSVSQMLAHCNVPYSYTFEKEKYKKPNLLKLLLLRTVVKSIVLSPNPYKRNSPTAPEFVIKDDRDFEVEKKKLIQNINKTQQLGESHFEGLENLSFGKMSAKEWNTMLYKHLDHHLSQFGV